MEQVVISEYLNEERRAKVIKITNGYLVECYVRDRIAQRIHSAILQQAEDIAEDYVGKSRQTLLNE